MLERIINYFMNGSQNKPINKVLNFIDLLNSYLMSHELIKKNFD